MVEVVVLMGLQAAGKTTFYRTRFAATHAHVSKDLPTGEAYAAWLRERLR